MLGTREPEKYGNTSLADIENSVINLGRELGVEVEAWQSNHEGEIVEKIQSAKGMYDGILINAGGYTHTSVVIRDAIASVQIPTVEIHMTNIHAREEFRHTSLISGVCIAQVVGFKEQSYLLALEGLIKYLQ
jgi:3-dehydroquinate dehydratase-2